MVDYNKRLVEVDEILNYLSEDDLIKIPEDIRNTIKENMDKQYVWKFDKTKSLTEQNLSRDTVILLSYLNMEYLLDEEQKQLMQQIHEFNERRSEELKLQKYSVDDLFKNKNQEKLHRTEQVQEKSLTEYKEESIFTKIINRIKKFFKRFRINE